MNRKQAITTGAVAAAAVVAPSVAKAAEESHTFLLTLHDERGHTIWWFRFQGTFGKACDFAGDAIQNSAWATQDNLSLRVRPH